MKKWFKNLKWLFSNPPTGITEITDPLKCDYCGAEEGIWQYEMPGYRICQRCMKKVYDSVLLKAPRYKEEVD